MGLGALLGVRQRWSGYSSGGGLVLDTLFSDIGQSVTEEPA